jgi:hypothetical protein
MSFKEVLRYRISIPAYAVEQPRWQSGVPKHEMSLMSFIFKMMLVLYQSVSISGSILNIYWHASKWSSISFSHWQCPSDRKFSFPRFVGILILSLCFARCTTKEVLYGTQCSLLCAPCNSYRLLIPWYFYIESTSKRINVLDWVDLGRIWPTNPHWAPMVGYGLFSLRVIH